MNVDGTSGSLSGAQLSTLFPFCFEISRSLKITALGPRWKSFAPAIAVGDDLFKHFAIERPLGCVDAATICASREEIFLLHVHGKPGFILRGQVLSLDGGDRILFVGGPWIIHVDDLAAHALGFGDFPPHDPRGDLLVLLQARETTLSDLKLLASRLRETAKRLDNRNKQLEEQIVVRDNLEAQLRHSQKMDAVGQLAGGIAHDFNNLIQAILGNLHFALAAGPDPEIRSYLADIESASVRAAALTKQLLAFSRRAPLKGTRIGLNELIRQFMLLIRRVFPESITVDFIAGHQLAEINGDAGQIEQVLMNLVLNARDAMPAGGRLILETENILINGDYAQTHPWANPGRHVLLTVTDTGVGMTPEVRDRIFEPFFTTKPAAQGSGLGLAVAFGIVQQHHGHLHVYSEPGHGTTFKLYLPVTERLVTVVGSKIDPLRARVGTETILLAEDEPLVRSMLTRVLERAGYRVLAAANGSEALRLCREHDEIDLALLDVIMPDFSGPEIYERMQEFRPGLPTLFASGYSDATRSIHRIPETATLLSKPFEMDVVLARVRELLDA